MIITSLIFSSTTIAVHTKKSNNTTNETIVNKEICRCSPEVDVKKDVWDPESGWVSANSEDTAADLPICTMTKFRIKVWNTGDCPVTGGVLDTMDDHLEYINSDPEPDDFVHWPPFYHMIWVYPEPINPGDVAPIIIIDAHVGGPECTYSYNHAIANFTCAHGTFVEDDDYAYVHATKKSKEINNPFLQFLKSHPKLFPLLNRLITHLDIF
jgi:hypothetical protein